MYVCLCVCHVLSYSAVGTAGQRCTTLRRLLLHEGVYETFLQRLLPAYASVKIGDPLDSATLCGPLHNMAVRDSHRKKHILVWV